MNVIREFLFGRNDLLEDLEEDAEKDMQVLQDIFFYHNQKMNALREVIKIWHKKAKIQKIDSLGKLISKYNVRLRKLIDSISKTRIKDESVVKMLIARNKKFAEEFDNRNIGALLERMEGHLRYLKTILQELDFIIAEQQEYLQSKRKGIVVVLKEIEEHKPFFNLLQDETKLEEKMSTLAHMLEREAKILHIGKKIEVEGPLIVEEVFSPDSRDFKLLHETAYQEAFPDSGELLLLKDFKEELEQRYKKIDKTHYHVLILKAGTKPIGGVMFDLYLFKDFCVAIIYYLFVDENLPPSLKAKNPAKLLTDTVTQMINRDAKNAGYRQISAILAEVDNPERKLNYKLKEAPEESRLKPDEVKSYERKMKAVINLFKRCGFKRADFFYTPSDLEDQKKTVTYFDLYLKPLKSDWIKSMAIPCTYFQPIAAKVINETCGMTEKDIRFEGMMQEIFRKKGGVVKLLD